MRYFDILGLYNVDPATLNYWMKTKPTQYYYIESEKK